MIRTILITGSMSAGYIVLSIGVYIHLLAIAYFFNLDLSYLLALMADNASDSITTTTIGVGDVVETREGVIRATTTVEVQYSNRT